tara:strand:+ start:230 stop:457 length:228 start_codon:yes stop_codon:yes gene_type:complete
MTKKQNNNQETMVTLYEFNGYAVGSEIGREIAAAAYQLGVKVETVFISNPIYSGPVNKYPESFLKQYYNLGLCQV